MILSKQKIKASDIEFKEKLVALNRVVKVVKGGRSFKFTAIMVVGNEKGIVGHGLGKSKDITQAIQKGTNNARKNLIKVPMQSSTIPHEVVGKFKGGHVFLKPAAPGTGIIAGAGARAILKIAGIHNILAKSKGSPNPHNVVKATFDALRQLRDPLMVARQRGISLDKVFNG